MSLLLLDEVEAEGLPSSPNDKDHHDDKKPPSALKKKEDRFPFKLYDLLQQSSHVGFEDIISWFPCGTKFKIHNQKKFEAEIMPDFFPGMTRYKSFRRQLNLYGINQWETKQRIELDRKEQGAAGLTGSGAYSHPFLVRNHRDFCFKIQRAYQQRPKPLHEAASRTFCMVRPPLGRSSTTSTQDLFSFDYALSMYGFQDGENGCCYQEEQQRGEELLMLEPEPEPCALLRAGGFQLSPTMSSFGIVDESRQPQDLDFDRQTGTSATTRTTSPFLSSSYASLTYSGCFRGSRSGFDIVSGERTTVRSEDVLQTLEAYYRPDLNVAEEPLSVMIMVPGIDHDIEEISLNHNKPSQEEINDEIIKTFLKQG